jgi:hypothetical protein
MWEHKDGRTPMSIATNTRTGYSLVTELEKENGVMWDESRRINLVAVGCGIQRKKEGYLPRLWVLHENFMNRCRWWFDIDLEKNKHER